MQKKVERKKLVLRKETIANLSDFEMNALHGGDGDDVKLTKFNTCNCTDQMSELGSCCPE